MNKVLVRFAPAPTGKLHVGNLQIAIINFLFAKYFQNKSLIILRIDDTNKKSNIIKINNICNTLNTFGIYFNKIFFQSDRYAIYYKYAEILLKNGFACKKDGSIILNVNAIENSLFITIHDFIKGKITIPVKDIYNICIFSKKYNKFTYNFASIIDDLEMGITHVIRGNDHITNTFVQHAILHALQKLGFFKHKIIQFGHLPLLLFNNKKMSKRFNVCDVNTFMQKYGIYPHSLISYFSNTNFIKLDDIVRNFDINKIPKNNFSIDIQKILSINKKIIRFLSYKEINNIISLKINKKIWNFIKFNIENLNDIYDILIKIDNFKINNFKFKSSKIYCNKLLNDILINNYDSQFSCYLRKIIFGSNNGPKLKELIDFFGKKFIINALKKFINN